MKRNWSVVLGLTVISMVGCGGGGSSVAIAPDPEVGGAQIRVAGKMSSQIASTAPGGLAVFGFTGAITKAYWSDATPTAEDGEIVVATRTPRGAELLAFDFDGNNQRLVVAPGAPADNIAVSPDGVWLYYVENSVLKRVPMAGGTPTTLLNDVFDFCLTPSGAKLLVFRPTAGTLSVINANGTGLVDRVINVGPFTDVIGAVTENFAFVATNYTSNDPEIYRLSLGGTLQWNLWLLLQLSVYKGAVLDWKRENIFISRYDSAASKNRWDVMRLVDTGAWLQDLRDDVDPNITFNSMSFLPDTKRMLVTEKALNGTWASLANDNLQILSRTMAITDPNAKTAFAAAPTFRTLVGAGNYASGAAAVMFSELANRTPAVVLADCTTRASMTLTRVSDDNDGTLIYQLTCDNLTKLHYTKSNSFTQVSVIGGITGLKGAFIAFNAETGRVSNVITFTKKPTVDRRPEGLVLRGGEMVDQFDVTGNRKPVGDSIILR